MFKGAEGQTNSTKASWTPIARSATDRVDPIHNQCCRWSRYQRTRTGRIRGDTYRADGVRMHSEPDPLFHVRISR
jgi:hypothetical protein